MQEFHSIQLSTSEIYKMFAVFQEIGDASLSRIRIPALLTFLGVERTKFAERVFSIFDQDKNGVVDFREFVLTVSNYCTLTPITLAMFAFDLYDTKKTGVLSLEDLEQLLREIF
ncbi:hypothetical protein B484DRAFT_333228, partial [Ochromonadaceae sp. CCMP2298]